jgi:hypothetical protein
MATKGAASLHGRFRPGTRVRLVKVDGPHVLRPGPGDETVATEKVDDDGCLSFKGLEVGERYFAVGYIDGQPVEVRLTGREDGDDSHLSGYEANSQYVRVKLADGSYLDEPPEQNQKQENEGLTWLGQHQVPKGTLQRSDTPRGAAAIISAEERERAAKQWRKQEPTDQVVEQTPDADENPARTAEPTDETPAKSGTKPKAKPAARKESN